MFDLIVFFSKILSRSIPFFLHQQSFNAQKPITSKTINQKIPKALLYKSFIYIFDVFKTFFLNLKRIYLKVENGLDSAVVKRYAFRLKKF